MLELNYCSNTFSIALRGLQEGQKRRGFAPTYPPPTDYWESLPSDTEHCSITMPSISVIPLYYPPTIL